jgi:hypothetical protein
MSFRFNFEKQVSIKPMPVGYDLHTLKRNPIVGTVNIILQRERLR